MTVDFVFVSRSNGVHTFFFYKSDVSPYPTIGSFMFKTEFYFSSKYHV